MHPQGAIIYLERTFHEISPVSLSSSFMSNALALFSFTFSLASFFELNLSFSDGASSISISLSIAPSTATIPDKNSYWITDFFLGCQYKIGQLGSTQKKIPTKPINHQPTRRKQEHRLSPYHLQLWHQHHQKLYSLPFQLFPRAP